MPAPITIAATTASAAPSVAVTTPPKIPPRIMAGRTSAQDASFRAGQTMAGTNFFSAGKASFRAEEQGVGIISSPPKTPRRKAATKNFNPQGAGNAPQRVIRVGGGVN